MKVQHVAIAGNIGAGKTTLTTMLAKQYGWEPMFEDANTNPYLTDFYDDMKRWAFNLQIYFLNSRYRQILEIRSGKKTVIQDRTIYEDAFIFAPNLYDMGLMGERDYNNYFELFDTMSSQVKGPDLLIYLKASIPTLVDHIQARGREYEGSISLDYLKRLNKRYDDWINEYNQGPLLIINVDDLDFQSKPEDFGYIIDKIEGQLGGLFSTMNL